MEYEWTFNWNPCVAVEYNDAKEFLKHYNNKSDFRPEDSIINVHVAIDWRIGIWDYTINQFVILREWYFVVKTLIPRRRSGELYEWIVVSPDDKCLDINYKVAWPFIFLSV